MRAALALALALGAAATIPALGQPAWPTLSTPPADEIQRLLLDWRFTEAEPIARDLLSRAEGRAGPASLETAAALDTLVEVLLFKREGNNPEVEALAQRAVAIRDAAQGPEHTDLARSLHYLATHLFNAGRYRDARATHARALAIRERALGPDHPAVADSLDRYLWSLLYGVTEDPQIKKSGIDILTLARRAVEIREKAYGPERPELARSLDNLGFELLNQGDLKSAKALHERALRIRQDSFGSDHPETACSLELVGYCLYALGDETTSNPLYEKSLAILEKALGPDHIDVGRLLEQLGIGYEIVGRYAEALPLLERAARIKERALGASHPEFGWALHDLGVYFYTTGDYARAAPYFERAIAIMKRSLPPDDCMASSPEWAYAMLLFQVGDLEAAQSLFDRAMEIMKAQHGPDHYITVSGMEIYSIILNRLGKQQQAIEHIEHALKTMEHAKGPRHWRVGLLLQALAEILAGTSDTERVRALTERSMSILEETLGPENDRMGPNFETLGVLSLREGHQTEARGLLERALALKEKTLGTRHPEVAITLNHLARALHALGETEPAFQAVLRAEEIGRGQLQLGARVLPERQALTYAGVRVTGLDLALTIAADDPGGDRARRMLETLVRSRTLVLDEMAKRHHSIFESGDPEILRLSDELSTARMRLANVFSRGFAGGSTGQYRKLLDELAEQKERAERALARKSSTFRNELVEREAGLAEMMAALPPDTALLSYVRYTHFAADAKKPAGGDAPGASTTAAEPGPSTARGEPSYLALITNPSEPYPILVPLGKAEPIDSLIRLWKEILSAPPRGSRAARNRRESESREAGERLRQTIWDPVAKHLGETRQVLIVPDGAVHLVNFGTLPVGKDRYLLETGPLVHYLSSERDLLKIAREPGHGKGYLVMGGPEFDAEPGAVAAAPLALAATLQGAPVAAASSGAEFYRSPAPKCADFRSLRFEPLPATRAEVDEIAIQLAGSPIPAGGAEEHVLRLTGPAAGEAAFKRLASGHRLVHIATHGFSLQGRCDASLEDSASRADNPLLLSGLALAGANRRDQLKADAKLEDGILTAEEIASLDLSGVEWVVLSACETGLGDVQASEGVLGLRRAFQVAGARTLIMSLWPVQDEAAREWMRALYSGRLSGLSTAQAVTNAGVELIERRRSAGKSTHPFFWGAWIATGSPR